MSRPLWSKLTPREQEIMAWVKIGTLDKETADKIGCSRLTVKKHVFNVTVKVKARNRTHAVAMLIEEKLQERIDELELEQTNLAIFAMS